MAILFEHKGFLGEATFDKDAGLFLGKVMRIQDIVKFEGSSVNETRTAFMKCIEDYLAAHPKIDAGDEPH